MTDTSDIQLRRQTINNPPEKLSNSILIMPPRTLLANIKTKFEELYGYKPHGNNKKFKELVNNNRLQNDTTYDKIKKLIDIKTNEIRNQRLNEQALKLQKIIRNNLRNKTIKNLTNLIKNNMDKITLKRSDYIKFIDPETYAFTIINNIEYLALLKINGVNYTMNETNKIKLLSALKDNVYDLDVDELGGSDNQLIYNLINTNTLIIERIKLTNKYKTAEGAFFPYYLQDDKNLKLQDYQIYVKNDIIKHNNENCLLYALNKGGYPIEKLEGIKTLIKRKHVPASDLKNICKKLNISIHLRKLKLTNGKNKSIVTKYGDAERVFNIGLIENHYFIINTTDYTSYSILNYDKIKHIKDFNYIVDNRGYKNKEHCINSFALISLLVDKKEQFLCKIDMGTVNELDEEYMLKRSENQFLDLTYDENDYKKSERITIKSKEDKLIFFDIETFNNNDNKVTPYLACSEDQESKKLSFIGEDCGLQLLKSLKDPKVTLIAHNAKFDSRCIIKHLKQCTEIENNGNFISFSGKFYNRRVGRTIKITIKDSYKLIPEPLKKFSKLFHLDDEKEYIDYNLYTETNIMKRYIPYDECVANADKEQKKIFNKNIYKWNCIKANNTIDIIEYSRRYCEIDVKVLRNGYNIFRDNCLSHFDIDINNVLTIPSLANIYFTNQGCYDGCYDLAGQPRNFIEKCIVGGRTMISNNEKKMLHKIVMNDFDAVSLYPSAMYRMDGFLKGLPKIIRYLEYDKIKDYDGYFVEIKINKVGIKRDFPLASIVDNKGVRQFTNDLEGEHVFVDKYSLEDLIQHQKIDFEIIKGYYFNDGFNTKIKEVIRYIFDKRNEYKKLGEPCEIIYKLIMNSGYGKSIQKAHDTKTKIFDTEKAYNAYISKNYNKVMSCVEYDKNKYKVIVSSKMSNHYNKCHIGCNILSMSKRIMNEVMTLAEDNNLDIYYQDTDSMHILDKNIKTLQELFNNKYKRELIGKDLGQFHSDFEIKDIKCDNVYARNSIFLGKKCYIDELVGTDKITGAECIDYHIRMKGVSNNAILHYCDNNNITPLQLYEKLYEGETVTFDLTCDGNKFIAKYDKDYTINHVTDFSRKINF